MLSPEKRALSWAESVDEAARKIWDFRSLVGWACVERTCRFRNIPPQEIELFRD